MFPSSMLVNMTRLFVSIHTTGTGETELTSNIAVPGKSQAVQVSLADPEQLCFGTYMCNFDGWFTNVKEGVQVLIKCRLYLIQAHPRPRTECTCCTQILGSQKPVYESKNASNNHYLGDKMNPMDGDMVLVSRNSSKTLFSLFL